MIELSPFFWDTFNVVSYGDPVPVLCSIYDRYYS